MLGSPVDIAILFGVALIVFGPKKLPELGKALGQGIGNFKKSLQEATDEVRSAMHIEESKSPVAKEPPEADAGALEEKKSEAGIRRALGETPEAKRD